jgi:hypothetical protein
MENNAQPQANETINNETINDGAITADKIANDAQGTEQTKQGADEPQEELLELKYNHEIVKKPKSEVIMLAQMGLNYDKVHSQLEELKNDEALKIADRIAAQYGITRADLLKKWEADLAENAAKEYAEKHEIPVDVAKEILENKHAITELKSEKERQKKEAEAKAETERQIKEFRKEYPDIKDEDVPDEVLRLWAEKKGITLVDAYKLYEYGKLKKEESIKKTNESNANSSMGPVQGQPNAPFKVTEEWIKKASLEEYEAHRDEVMKWYNERSKK